MDLNEQELFRRESLSKLRELGIEPYPAPLFPINTSAEQIKAEYDAEKGNFQDVVIAGRIMSRRIMGAASFGEIQAVSRSMSTATRSAPAKTRQCTTPFGRNSST